MEEHPPFVLRLYQPSDFDAVLAVIQAAAQADSLPQRTTAAELRARLQVPHADPRLDPADDMWVVSKRSAGIVAYADGWLNGQAGTRGYRTECFVRPDQRGRGIGRALLARQVQRAQAIARKLATPGEPVTLTVSARAWQQQPAAAAVLEAKSLRRVRTYLEMSRDLSQPVAAAAPPAGLRLEPWTDPRADEAIWQAYEAAFSDHWGYQPESFESFSQRLLVGRVQRQHSVVAWAGGLVAGASLNDMDESRARGPAWVRQLFVRRDWRGRGLGRALLAASLGRARDLGYGHAGLMVDAENQTGALRLYQAAGFEVSSQRHTYQLQLSANIEG
jgi:GNAT superfamily N-acetyltransferase